MFKNRREAGLLLAEKLKVYSNNPAAVVVTIPRGGVPIGFAISQKLNLPLELVLSKKIGHPVHREFAIGAATANDIILSESAAGVPEAYVLKETASIRELLSQRHKKYYGNKVPLSLLGKIVILVDDGVATGHTLISSIDLLAKEKPAEIIVALPVGPSSTIKKINDLSSVNKTICLLMPPHFQSVGQFYKNFLQVTDKEVVDLLNDASNKQTNISTDNFKAE